MPALKKLHIDEKWAVMYDPNNNDRPVFWSRYGEHHSVFTTDNAYVAMFYALLETTEVVENNSDSIKGG